MKLAIYRLKTSGEINRIHEIPEEKESWLESAVPEYNRKNYKDTVEVVELSDLELFLYKRSEISIKEYEEYIQDMSETLLGLDKSLEWLCDKVKEANQPMENKKE